MTPSITIHGRNVDQRALRIRAFTCGSPAEGDELSLPGYKRRPGCSAANNMKFFSILCDLNPELGLGEGIFADELLQVAPLGGRVASGSQRR
jgi:hypothetical protein